MEAILNFFSNYAPIVYALLAIGLVLGSRRFGQARQELREAVYGLEREIAQHHRNQAVSILVTVASLALAEFFLIIFLTPNLSSLARLPTQTVNLLATTTSALSPDQFSPLGSPLVDSATPAAATGCIPGQIMITAPKPGDELQGQAVLTGTADIPNFGFYKYEFSLAGADSWSTVEAHNQVVLDGKLGNWDTSNIAPGDYLLRLVVTDNQGNILPACVVPVRIKAP